MGWGAGAQRAKLVGWRGGFYRFGWLLCALGLLALGGSAAEQVGKTRVRGIVLDAKTKQPVPYATVGIKGTVSGTISDDQGRFFLTSSEGGDTLVVAYVGYETAHLPIKRGHFQDLSIALQELTIAVGEVHVYRDEGPVRRLLDSVVARRDRHNHLKLPSYRCQVYNKLQIDVNNVDTSFLQKGPLRQLGFVRQHLDTNAATGKSFIPVFISETLSHYHYSSSPYIRREKIVASHLSGVENDDYAQFTGALHQEFNIYSNYISVFNQGLVSPIHSGGWGYYDYFLVDSALVDGARRYQVSFRPKRRYEPTFRGYIWVDGESYAVVEAQYELARDANLNFVNYVMGQETYQRLPSGQWFPKQKHFFMDLNLSDRELGLFGHKTTLYDSVAIPAVVPPHLLREPSEVIVAEEAHTTSRARWDSIRPVPLNGQERGIYAMVDSVKQLPIYRGGRTFWLMMAERHVPLRYVDIGPWPRLYARNEVEGHRFSLGLRTNKDLMPHVQLWALGGYGTWDRRWKWEGGGLWVLKRKPWRTLRFEAGHEVEVLGQGKKTILENNILAAILREQKNYKLTMVDQGRISYFHEWHAGLSAELSVGYQRIYPTRYVPFALSRGGGYESLRDAYASLELRWKHRERFVAHSFYRQSAGSRYPEISLSLRGAIRGVAKADFSYLRIGARFRQKVHMNPVGYSWVLLEGGMILGRIPYPLLRLHEGNGTYALSRYHFNMLGHYEFASDRWISLLWEHHFMGLLFNHIPYVRRLNLREVLTAKVLVGDARRSNLEHFVPPEGLRAIGAVPYTELSAGVENIFHLLRVDAVWRLTHQTGRPGNHFTVRLGMALQF